MAMSHLCLVGPEGNPANALIRYIFNNAGLDRAVEDSEAIECALPSPVGRLACNIFDNHKPVRPIDSVGEAGKGAVTIRMDEQFVVAEDGRH